jgi:ATP-dependent DNA helicase RecG
VTSPKVDCPTPAPSDRPSLRTPVRFLPGVGPRRADLLATLGLETVGDALRYLPRTYEDRRDIRPIGRLGVGETGVTVGEVVSSRVIRSPRRGARLFEAVISDGRSTLTGVWFHFREPGMTRLFTAGRRFLFRGEVQWNGERLSMIHPEVEEVAGGGGSVNFDRIVPVYRLTGGISQRVMRGIFHRLVTSFRTLIEEDLPAQVAAKYHLPPLAESLANLHFPPLEADIDALLQGRSPWHKRVVFGEFLFLELFLLHEKARRRSARRRAVMTTPTSDLQAFTERLPFSLTGAQRRVFEEIRADLGSPHPMHRLLQGDVGSGKTAVMAMAVLMADRNGFQTAVMAPTEILARQHQRTLASLLGPAGPEPVLLVSGLPAPERRRVIGLITGGVARLVVGTHALVEGGVDFPRLGLAIVDEQHRFGVAHRRVLREKGDDPHTLVVSATPIPRTLAMTLYGDMDVSLIDEMPPGRTPVTTRVVREADRDRFNAFLAGRLARGEQVFVVYPLVEESARTDLRDAKGMAVRLAGDFPGHAVGLLHGRLRQAEKAAAMDAFREGATRILVSTTVIEVGVDVPQATVMVIEHAERFGLAQLHQLRGRVGRGGGEAFCLLVVSDGAPAAARERLELMPRIADGFQLAEEDLRLRGPGELSGLRQSGAPDLLLASVIRHRRALEFARREAEELLDNWRGRGELTKLIDRAIFLWKDRAGCLESG